MKRLIFLTAIFILTLTTSVRAEITPQLLNEWAKQPNNVQWDVYYQNTNIQVVDNLDWTSPDLYETHAYTTMNVSNGYVNSIDIRIKRGYEYALTHEVGHALSNVFRIPYGWCTLPDFIRIWQKERYNNVLLAQGWNDIREYFACAYDLYINYPQLLKQTCPDTYNFMTVVLRNT